MLYRVVLTKNAFKILQTDSRGERTVTMILFMQNWEDIL